MASSSLTNGSTTGQRLQILARDYGILAGQVVGKLETLKLGGARTERVDFENCISRLDAQLVELQIMSDSLTLMKTELTTPS